MSSDFFSSFQIFHIISILIFAVAAAFIAFMFIYILSKRSRQERANNRAPQETVPAQVVTKRVAGGGEMPVYYYATFELDDRNRIEMPVSGTEFGMLADGDRGMLTHQGTRYLGFERI